MMTYEKVRAIQEYRFGKYTKEADRAHARKTSPANAPGGLSDLLNALAQGLAGIGLPRRGGKSRPASPAY